MRWTCRACISDLPCSSPRFRSTPNEACGGCQIHVTDRLTFRPVITGVALIQTFRRFDRSKFAWRQPPHEYEQEKLPIDILAGSDLLRTQIESDVSLGEIAASWRPNEAAFRSFEGSFCCIASRAVLPS